MLHMQLSSLRMYHYCTLANECSSQYFITKDGSYNGISKDNFKTSFGKDFKEKHTYDKGTNTDPGPSFHGEMEKWH